MRLAAVALSIAAAFGASTASAVTVSIVQGGTFDASVGSFVLEDFEDATPGVVGPSLATSVGTLFTLGGTGTGATVVGDGTELVVKDETTDSNLGGRFNVTPFGSKFVDSNDTDGMGLLIDIGEAFTTIAFSLTDVADVGATMTITASDGVVLAAETLSKLSDANLQLVTVTFSEAVDFAGITLENSKLNDGFGIDDIYVGTIPLPASAILLLTGLGLIGALRRRQNRTA